MKRLILAIPALIYAGLDSFAPAPGVPTSTSTSTSTSTTTTTTGGVDVYAVDGVHSTVLFKVRHLGVSDFRGRFGKVGGTVKFDTDKPARRSLEVEIDASSVDTGDENRDKHLMSPQFFNVKQHSSIRFESKKWVSTGTQTFAVTGDLTLLGESKSITVDATYSGKKDTHSPRFGVRAGFVARFKIKRSDFGMKYMVKNGMLGNEVEVVVNLEGVLQK